MNFPNKTISYYGSLLGEKPIYLDKLLDYLTNEFRDRKRNVFERDNWNLIHPKAISIQTNKFDCGMFLYKYSKFVFQRSGFNFNQVYNYLNLDINYD